MNSSQQMDQLMRGVAKKLHLAAHPVRSISGHINIGFCVRLTLVLNRQGSRAVHCWRSLLSVFSRLFTRKRADVEGHKSNKDGRFYLIDLARLLPPVPPRSNSSDHLYKQFRPEFMIYLQTKAHSGSALLSAYSCCFVPALSSDAFSRWGLQKAGCMRRQLLMMKWMLVQCTTATRFPPSSC